MLRAVGSLPLFRVSSLASTQEFLPTSEIRYEAFWQSPRQVFHLQVKHNFYRTRIGNCFSSLAAP